jgi:hypothetical protein
MGNINSTHFFETTTIFCFWHLAQLFGNSDIREVKKFELL